MAYEIISQNNTVTTLADENGNVIRVPSRAVLAVGETFTLTKVNNNMATLEDSSGKIYRDVPCVAVLYGGGAGGDQHNLGYYATQAALEEAYPTAEAGDWAIVGATDTVWIWDEDTSAWVDSDQKGQVVSVNSKTGTVVLDAFDVDAVAQFETLPAASQANAGKVVQYVGAPSASYTNGYFYKNIATTTASSATASQTTGSSLTDVAVVVATFETQITTSGSYVFTSDGADWSYDGNVVDLTDYGITYTGTPVADDAITVVYSAATTSYAWTRIDVQPAPSGLPDQTGQSGKFLTTDGTDASWSDKPLVNTATGTNSITVGGTANSTNRTTTLGIGAEATGLGGISVGRGAKSTNSCVSVGELAATKATDSIAIGNGATTGSNSTYGIAIGSSAYITNSCTHCIALGSSTVSANNAIQISSSNSAATNSDANTFKVANNNGNFEIMSADGTIPADRLTKAINKYSTMPTAASTNEGWIVQYTGATDATYTHGYIYECVSDGGNPATYSWTAVQVQAGGGGGSYTAGTGIDITGTTISTEIPMAISSTDSTAPTVVASATGSGVIAIGASSEAGSATYGDQSIAIGEGARAKSTLGGYQNVAIGGSSFAGGASVAIGYSSHSGYLMGVAVGCNMKAYEGVILGSSSTQMTGTRGGFDLVLYDYSTYSSNQYNVMTKDGQINPARLGTGYDATKTQTLKNVQGVLTWVDD